jgi:MFS family permease
MASVDRTLIYAAVLLRATATAFGGVLLALWCKAAGLSDAQTGVVLSAGLWGAAAACLLVTWRGDALGRRRCLVALALLAGAGALAFAATRSPALLAVAAFLGMLNGMGRDRGAALVLEQAILPATTDAAGRTRAFAVYNVLQDGGHALGSVLAGVPLLAASDAGADAPAGFAGPTFLALLLALPLLAYARLSPAAEAPAARAPLSAASRRALTRISGLFFIDALAGGFLLTSLLAWFFHERFGLEAQQLGPLFAAARVLNAFSHLGAAWLARRIGLVRTMVFTHIPSSVLLLLVPWAPSFPVAAALFLLREGLVEMDVPTRQSYVMALVAPHERTTAAGVTGLVRMAGWAVSPMLAGVGMQQLDLGVPLVVGAALKISYDLLLWRAFRHVRPPEEARAG